jgi:hypothetical protein
MSLIAISMEVLGCLVGDHRTNRSRYFHVFGHVFKKVMRKKDIHVKFSARNLQESRDVSFFESYCRHVLPKATCLLNQQSAMEKRKSRFSGSLAFMNEQMPFPSPQVLKN